MHFALVVLGELQTAGGKVVDREVGRGQVRVFHERGQVREPAGLFELPLLHVIADVNDIKTRLAGSQFDDGLLPLLLLRDDFGFDLDTGKVGELGRVFLQQFASWPLDQVGLDGGAGILLPLRLGARGKSGKAERSCRRGAGQNGTTRNKGILHWSSPWRSAYFDGMLAPARFRQQPDHDVCGCFVWFSPRRLASAAAPQTALHKVPLNRRNDPRDCSLRNGSAAQIRPKSEKTQDAD